MLKMSSSLHANKYRDLSYVPDRLLWIDQILRLCHVFIFVNVMIYVQCLQSVSWHTCLIASRTAPRFSQFVHLRDPLLELFILTFLVRMPLVLQLRHTSLACLTIFGRINLEPLDPQSRGWRDRLIPRISMEGRIVHIDSDSAGSGGWHSCHGIAVEGERRTFLLWSLPGLCKR